MVTVGVDNGCLKVDSQLTLVGLVWGLAAGWCLVCIHWMNRVDTNSCTMTQLYCTVIHSYHIISARRYHGE